MIPILPLLEVAASLIQTGYNAYTLLDHAKDNTAPATSPVEQFVSITLQELPRLMEGGVDVAGMVTKMRDSVALMQAEGRGPNAQELAEQEQRLRALDERFDKAAAYKDAPFPPNAGPGT